MAAIAGLLVPGPAARAQTDVSLRIRSMGVSLAGIVDDYLTDVFLNPAHTSQLDGTTIYAARLPGRTLAPPYRYATFQGFADVPLEQNEVSLSYTPVVFSLFRSTGRVGFSVAGEVDVYTDEYERDDQQIRFDVSSLEYTTRNYGRTQETQHYLGDITVATGTQNALGGRLTGSYDRRVDGDATISDDGARSLTDPVQAAESFRSDFRNVEFERLTLSASVGLLRPRSLVREVVVGAGVQEERMVSDTGSRAIVDPDVDGDGTDLAYSSFRVDATDYMSARDYEGYTASTRVVLEPRSYLRVIALGLWSRNNGAGNASFRVRDETGNPVQTLENTRGGYSYDGTVETASMSAVVGAHDQLTEKVLIAVALRGFYRRTRFCEDGDGTAWITIGGVSNPVDTTLTSPYQQGHDSDFDDLELAIPAGIEWAFHRYATLRVGLTFVARRSESDEHAGRNLPGLTNQPGYADLADLSVTDYDAESDTGTVLSNGLEINVNERFILDLLFTGYLDSTINLLSFSFMSVRFNF